MRLLLPLAACLASGALGTGHAQEDGGPDYYRVGGISPGSALNLRAGPSLDAAVLARVPAGTTGLRNLGCEGGLSFAEWSAATETEREAGRRSRWCRVEYRGTEGWLAGWFLVEGGPPEAGNETAASADVRRIDVAIGIDGSAAYADRVAGYETVDYVVDAVAGTIMSVALERENRFIFFNVLPPGSPAAVFAGAGSLTPDDWSGVLRDSGAFTVRVFLMRNAARREETGAYSIQIGLQPSARPPLAGYVPAPETDFDATAVTRCSVDDEALGSECGLGVYRGATTQTVFVERPPGTGSAGERGFVFRGGLVELIDAGVIEARRDADNWLLTVDERERYVVPDAVLTGG